MNPWKDGVHPFDHPDFFPSLSSNNPDVAKRLCGDWISQLASTEFCFDLSKGGDSRKFTKCQCLQNLSDVSAVADEMIRFASYRQQRDAKGARLLRLIDSCASRKTGQRNDLYNFLEEDSNSLFVCRNAAQALLNCSKKMWENRKKMLLENKRSGKNPHAWKLRKPTDDNKHLPLFNSMTASVAQSPSSSECSGLIDDSAVTDKDVLVGMSSPRSIRHHPGNKLYQALIGRHHQKYQESKEYTVKNQICCTIIKEILSNGGKFLAWNPSSKSPLLTADGTPFHSWQILNYEVYRFKTSAALKNKNLREERVVDLGGLDTGPSLELDQFRRILKIQQDLLNGGAMAGIDFHCTSEPGHTTIYREPSVLDVCASIRGCYNHLGNKLFVALIRYNGNEYKQVHSASVQKRRIVHSIWLGFHKLGGRFLEKRQGGWVQQSVSVSLCKIAQALRDSDRLSKNDRIIRANQSLSDLSWIQEKNDDIPPMDWDLGSYCSLDMSVETASVVAPFYVDDELNEVDRATNSLILDSIMEDSD